VEFDAALIERARRGDSRAFERLYREHVGRVHGLCLRMTRNPDLAADCVQDAFIKAWKALPKFEARSTFSTWLHRIAVNTVLEKRRGPSNAEIAVEDPTELAEPVMTFDSPVEEEELEAAIESLPQGARDALVLCGVYGYETFGSRRDARHRGRHLQGAAAPGPGPAAGSVGKRCAMTTRRVKGIGELPRDIPPGARPVARHREAIQATSP
jgi:RNA polymerase sigma-70 factor (ECF subfamily)